jgi:hypothetical protein
MVLRAKRNHEVSNFMRGGGPAGETLAANAPGLARLKPILRDRCGHGSGFAVAKLYSPFTETLDRAGKA